MPSVVAALVVAGAAVGLPGAGAQSGAGVETLYLDVQANGREPSVASSRPLAAGVPYRVTVSGTVSIWPAGGWERKGGCGEPLLEPQTPSPGRVNGPVGLDAEMVWAMAQKPATFECVDGALPRHVTDIYAGGLAMDPGGGWRHVEPVGGPPTRIAPKHAYTYEVVGEGAPLRLRYGAKHDGDDYGVFTIRIAPADGGQGEVAGDVADGGGPAEPVPPGAQGAGDRRSLLPPRRFCTRRRVLVIKLRNPRGDRLRRATVIYLGLNEQAERHGRRLWARVDLSRSKRRRIKVTVVARTVSGETWKSTRRYRTCVGR